MSGQWSRVVLEEGTSYVWPLILPGSTKSDRILIAIKSMHLTCVIDFILFSAVVKHGHTKVVW